MKYKLIAFDADDTLWDCQSHFEMVEDEYVELLKPYGLEAQAIRQSLFDTECANMPLLGFGVKAFMLSLIQNANKMTHGAISGNGIERIFSLGTELLTFDPKPLEGVRETLAALGEVKDVQLAVFTKGELLDQNGKLDRSGLRDCFDHVEVVSDKTPTEVRQLCRNVGVMPEDMLMVGNSFKSDIIPAISTGASAVYVPAGNIWQYEVAEEYDHQCVTRIGGMAELLAVLGLGNAKSEASAKSE